MSDLDTVTGNQRLLTWLYHLYGAALCSLVHNADSVLSAENKTMLEGAGQVLEFFPGHEGHAKLCLRLRDSIVMCRGILMDKKDKP